MKQILITGCSVSPAALLLLVYLPTSDLLVGGPPAFELGRIGELLKTWSGYAYW
ncbi:MAG: hypothetical protein OXI67_02275 [Candidatus Poribacteria bacterium]|nr:hypothetical protein [Candidatus Poribacteria bacterium]